AQLQLKKGPLLAEIELLKNQARHESAVARVASLRKSHQFRDQAELAGVRIFELQHERQQVALDRAESNLKKLVVKAPLEGMVAHESIWRSGSMGPPQEGDQIWSGQPLVKIFDPTHMVVQCSVNEPDGVALVPGTRAKVFLDAYPELIFDAVLESASPVAASALGSPIKTFAARFRFEQVDPRLLPDLSVAVEIAVDLEAKKP
ncbi:MAG: efflux RND transporter periplasmic adaptor subunit, partial [Bryobacteraceae bacterium]